MLGKITVTLEVDANEVGIMIAALKEAANREEAANRNDVAETLDRVRYEIEEQVG